MGKGPEVKRISPLGKTKSGSDGWGWSIKMKWQEMRMHRRGGDWKGSMKSKKMLEHKFMAFDLTERKETMMKEENAVSGKD